MKEIIKDLKELQKFIEANEFKQEGMYNDSGEYQSGTLLNSKPIKSRVAKLINKTIASSKIAKT